MKSRNKKAGEEKLSIKPGAKPIETATLSIRIQPNASKNEILGITNEVVKIRINAPPVDDRANKECIAFLAKVLNVPKSHVSIMRGHKARSKVIQVLGMSQDVCIRFLNAETSEP